MALMGACSVMITASALVILAIWHSAQYNNLANQEIQVMINASLDNITQGVYNLVRAENDAVQQQVDNNLNVAGRLLEDAGKVSLSEETLTWTAANQFTNEPKRLSLPKVLIGGSWLGRNADPGVETPVVDEVARLVGETATIFQRMNERGDMLRIATTVKTMAGARAIGIYIPAVNPDGSDNPVISTVLKGETYHGRAYVVNGWYLTAYKPLADNEGTLVGMLYVGVKQKTVESRVRQAILQTRVGKTGYIYVLAGTGAQRGRYIISCKGQRDGEDIWQSQDSHGRYIVQEIIGKATALDHGEMDTIRYLWQNPGEPQARWKVVRLAYFAPWDWVIGTGVYEEELQVYHAVLSEGRSRMIRGMAMAGILIIFLVGMVSVFITWTITRPVRQITGVAEKITGGDLNQVVEVHSHDEIGVLASTFNLMTGKLKQTMEGLSKSEEKYRGIFENAMEGLFLNTLDGHGISANPAMASMLGYDSPEDLITSVYDIKNQVYVNPKDRDIMIDTLLKQGEVSNYEVQYYRKNKEKIWVSLSARLVRDDKGQPLHIEGFITNISARKYAEESLAESRNYLNEIINTVADPVFVKDSQHRWVLLNNALCTFMRHTREELLGKSDYDYSPKDEADVFWAKDELVMSTGKENINEEAFTDSQGMIHILVTKKTLYTDRKGEKFIVGIFRDITEQRHAEEEKKQLEARLSQAQKMEAIGTLAGGIAHDFNNILSAIIGYTELAMEDITQPDKATGELKEVLKAGDRARDLVRQILTFSRRTESVYSPLELRSVIKESIKMLRSVIPSTIEIRQNLAAPGLIMSDPTQINQIMINLCTNAAHAMDETGGILEISLQEITLDSTSSSYSMDLSPGHYVRVTISDTGKGMPPDIMGRIFEPYFTTKELGRGTGLGLSVIHGIVKSHNGAITCTSAPHKGTTFEVYFPRLMAKQENGEPAKETQFPGGNERILFVDDEEALANLAVEMLSCRGYRVTSRTSSIDALNLFREDPQGFDLVITDMTMPEMTGDKLAQELLAIRGDVPIILCTGYNEHISEERALEIGIKEFILKPLDMGTLTRTIRKVFDDRQAH